MAKPKTAPVQIFGTTVDSDNADKVKKKLERYITGKTFHHIVTPNTEMVVRARRDKQFRDLINAAQLRLADGIGLIWFSRWVLENQRIETVHGADIVEDIFTLAKLHGKQILLIGNKAGLDPHSAETAARTVAKRYPGLHIGGLSIEPDSQDHELELVRHVDPDIVLVGLGAPQQDFWIKAHRGQFRHATIAVGVGATIDYLSGAQKRSPRWMQKMELEWLWRLITQPKRLGRQLAIPYFLWLMLLVKLRLLPNKPLR